MRISEDVRVLGPDGGEVVEIEEAAVVDLVPRDVPGRWTVVLIEEKGVELVGAVVDLRERRVHGGRDVARRLEERPETSLNHVGLPRARGPVVGGGRRCGRQMADRRNDARELRGSGIAGRNRQSGERRLEDATIAARRRGVARLGVANHERAPFSRDGDVLRLELDADLPAKDRQEHLLGERARRRRPVDVEMIGVDRARRRARGRRSTRHSRRRRSPCDSARSRGGIPCRVG